MKLLISCVAITAGALMALGCKAEEIKRGGPYYYATFKTKSLPEQPMRQLTADEVKQPEGRTYYVAYFNDRGKLVKFTKNRRGQIDWESEYEYDPSGKLLRGRTVDGTGADAVQTNYVFDNNGSLVSQTRSSR